MKKCLPLILVILLLAPYSSLAAQRGEFTHEEGFHLHEFSVNVGYGFGELKPENAADYEVFPLFMQFGFDINSKMGLSDHRGTLQFVMEPFANPISDPEGGAEIGMALMMKYAYPFLEHVSFYTEVGSGPMYLGVDTYEQGNAGFSFLDQVGGGFQYFIDNNKALNVGYRFRHISHASLRDSPNSGINTHAIIAGISLFY